MNVFVGNLPFTLSEEQIESLFSSYGVIRSVRLIIDRNTGRSRGFGFVDMAIEEQALEAISILNGYEIEGRAISVSAAHSLQYGLGPVEPRQPVEDPVPL